MNTLEYIILPKSSSIKGIFLSGLVLIIFLIIPSPSKAQLTQGISINTNGNVNYTGAILDLSNGNTPGLSGFLPPYVFLDSATVIIRPITGDTAANSSGLLVYNTNSSITATNGLSGAGLYYWNNNLTPPSWVYMSNEGTISVANNGLSLSANADTIQLGGNKLIKTTKIPNNGYTLSIEGSQDTTIFNAKGQVGIGNTSPGSSAILDLTNNTNHQGLLLPGMTTAQLPATPKAGLVVYNSTRGCPEYYNGSSWITMGSHGSITFPYSGAVQSWTVPPCISILTIIASGGAGGYQYSVYPGGPGAIVYDTISVTSGHTLSILVGDSGSTCYFDGGGGGGGSFVWDNANTNFPLVAAGGGGGGSDNNAGTAGSTTTAAAAGSQTGTGGTTGLGGAVGTGTVANGPGGGGAGWLGNGGGVVGVNEGNGGYDRASAFSGGSGATTGGTWNLYGNGGYGGGGGGGWNSANNEWGSGGGGGGYNGGGGGNTASTTVHYGGGGGGSGRYNISTNTFKNAVHVFSGNCGPGSVTIIW